MSPRRKASDDASEHQQQPFCQVPQEHLLEVARIELTGAEARLYVHLLGRCYMVGGLQGGRPWSVGLNQLSRETGLSKPSVHRAVEGLEQSSLIKVERGGGRHGNVSTFVVLPRVSGMERRVSGSIPVPSSTGIRDETRHLSEEEIRDSEEETLGVEVTSGVETLRETSGVEVTCEGESKPDDGLRPPKQSARTASGDDSLSVMTGESRVSIDGERGSPPTEGQVGASDRDGLNVGQRMVLTALHPIPGESGRAAARLAGGPASMLSQARKVVRYSDLAGAVLEGTLAFGRAYEQAQWRERHPDEVAS